MLTIARIIIICQILLNIWWGKTENKWAHTSVYKTASQSTFYHRFALSGYCYEVCVCVSKSKIDSNIWHYTFQFKIITKQLIELFKLFLTLSPLFLFLPHVYSLIYSFKMAYLTVDKPIQCVPYLRARALITKHRSKKMKS